MGEEFGFAMFVGLRRGILVDGGGRVGLALDIKLGSFLRRFG